jgi:hypothetical protein
MNNFRSKNFFGTNPINKKQIMIFIVKEIIINKIKNLNNLKNTIIKTILIRIFKKNPFFLNKKVLNCKKIII